MNISSVLFTGRYNSPRAAARSQDSSDEERSSSPMQGESADTLSIRGAQKKPETFEAYEQADVEEESPFAFSAPSPPPSNDQPVQVPEPVLFAEPERPRYNPNKKPLSFAEQLRQQRAEEEALDQLANTSLGGSKARKQDSSGRKERKAAAPYRKHAGLKPSKLNPEQSPEPSTSAAPASDNSTHSHTAFSLPFAIFSKQP